MLLKIVLSGMLQEIPGFKSLRPRVRQDPGFTARYCYSTWLRHLVTSFKGGLQKIPEAVAELGPGDSLGTGLAAILSGAARFYALDILPYADSGQNLRVFEELVELFKARSPVPGNDEFPDLKPPLEDYPFPSWILSEALLKESLAAKRLEAIRQILKNTERKPVPGGLEIRYFVPWCDPGVIQEQSLDMIFSQAVLEHVTDLSLAYGAMSRWLKPGGWMSHQIDFKSHGTSKYWNGHWRYPSWAWDMITGKRKYFLNRQPCSVHLALHREHGFEITGELRYAATETLSRHQLASPFRNFSEADFSTSGVLIQSRKK